MLSIFLAMIVVVNGQDCLRANNPNGLPPFMDYRGSDLLSDTIPELHQVIIPSYRFTCCGNITEWGVDVHPAGGRFDGVYTLHVQVWRPSPIVETTGCYSLVGENMFTSVPLTNQVATVIPQPEDRIQIQRGDVLGFMLENTDGADGGVVLLRDSVERDDNGYETEEVWHADTSNSVIGNALCPFPVGSQPGRILNTFTSAAPVISVSYSIIQCPFDIIPTTQAPEPILIETLQPTPITNPDKATDSMLDQSGTEDTPLNHGSDPHFNTGLIVAITVSALMVVIIVLLTAVLCFVICRHVKNQKNDVPMATNEACGTGLQDTAMYTEGDTYDYPSIDNQATDSIDTKKNEAYATNAEAKPCMAYATSAETKPCVAYTTNVTTERNDAYGIKLQDVVMCREGDTYDYPTMDS